MSCGLMIKNLFLPLTRFWQFGAHRSIKLLVRWLPQNRRSVGVRSDTPLAINKHRRWSEINRVRPPWGRFAAGRFRRHKLSPACTSCKRALSLDVCNFQQQWHQLRRDNDCSSPAHILADNILPCAAHYMFTGWANIHRSEMRVLSSLLFTQCVLLPYLCILSASCTHVLVVAVYAEDFPLTTGVRINV